MGYNTDFSGELFFTEDMTVTGLRRLNELLDLDPDDRLPGKPPEYVALKVTKSLTGLQWTGAEKTYGMDEVVKWLIARMRETHPNFGLKGTLLAEGEERGDVWHLVVDGDKVEKRRIDPDAALKATKNWQDLWTALSEREQKTREEEDDGDYAEDMRAAFDAARKTVKSWE